MRLQVPGAPLTLRGGLQQYPRLRTFAEERCERLSLDAQTGAELWQSHTIASANFGGPAVANGVVFFGGSGLSILGAALTGEGVGGAGELIAFDTSSGDLLYRTRLRAGRGGGFSIADGRVFVGTGFSFFVSDDEPVRGFLEVFRVP